MTANQFIVNTPRGTVTITVSPSMWLKLTDAEREVYKAIAEEVFGEELGGLK